MKKCLGYQLRNWSMPPRLFRTSITLIRTSPVHLISFLLNSVSLQYPKQIFILAITYISLYIYSIPFLRVLRKQSHKQKIIFYLLSLYPFSSLSSKLRNPGHSIYLPSLISEMLLSSPKKLRNLLNFTQVQL